MQKSTDEIDELTAVAESALATQILWRRIYFAGVGGLILVIAATVTLPIVIDPSFFGLTIYGGGASVFGLVFLSGRLLELRDAIVSTRSELSRLQERRRFIAAGGTKSRATLLNRYKNDLPELVEGYRVKARAYRRTYNTLQAIIIFGSIASSTVVAAFGARDLTDWIGVSMSLIVAVSASFSSFFKFRERSSNLQRAADEIESEQRAVELRIGDYAGKPAEQALHDFATKVEGLRTDQRRQERDLDQPADVTSHVAHDVE